MERDSDVVKTALGVLIAIAAREQPDQTDIDTLRELAGSPPQAVPLDKLACELIQKILLPTAVAASTRAE